MIIFIISFIRKMSNFTNVIIIIIKNNSIEIISMMNQQIKIQLCLQSRDYQKII
jgi:hypothetical protein